MQEATIWTKNLESLKKNIDLYSLAEETIFLYNDVANYATVDKKGLIETICGMLSITGQAFNSSKISDTYDLWACTLDVAFCDSKNGFTNNPDMKEAILANLAEIYEVSYSDYRGIFYEELLSIIINSRNEDWYYSFCMCYALIDTTYSIRPNNYDRDINRNLTTLVDAVREFDGFYGLLNKTDEVLNNLDLE